MTNKKNRRRNKAYKINTKNLEKRDEKRDTKVKNYKFTEK